MVITSKTNHQTRFLSTTSLFTTFLLIGLFLLTLTSCSDEEDEAVGTWELVDWSLSGCPDSDDNFSLSFDDTGCIRSGENELCSTVRQTFNEDGTYVVTGSINNNGSILISADDRGTWQRNAGVFETCDENGDCNTDITVRINGDRATVTRGLNGCISTQIYERT